MNKQTQTAKQIHATGYTRNVSTRNVISATKKDKSNEGNCFVDFNWIR